jgi:type IV secretory pathway VirD2 relaxase
MPAPPSAGGMNAGKQEAERFAKAESRQICMESGGLITTAALARHAHGTHTHLSVGIANKLE